MPAAVAAVLPPRLEPDPADPGGCVGLLRRLAVRQRGRGRVPRPGPQPVQRVHPAGERPLPGRGRSAPAPTSTWTGTPPWPAAGSRAGPRSSARSTPRAPSRWQSKAAPRVEPGGRFGGTLAANGRRLAEAVVELEKVSDDPVYFGQASGGQPTLFPAAGRRRHGPSRRYASWCARILSGVRAHRGVGGGGRYRLLCLLPTTSSRSSSPVRCGGAIATAWP